MGRKLTIYMLDGSATGPKTVEIGNWSGKAIYSPRASLKNLLRRAEFQAPGVYFLQSPSASRNYTESVYIGEAEQLRSRLKQHMVDRDFVSVISFISKDDMLTKAHIKYLESRLISLARDAKSSYVENTTSPKEPRLSEADISDMEYFIEQVTMILPVTGMRTLVPAVAHPVQRTTGDEVSSVFHIKSTKLKATMVEVDGAFIVKAGSEATRNTAKSLGSGWGLLRNKLLSTGALIDNGQKYVFIDDTEFASPSAASSVVLGRQAPGPISWVDEREKTYKQVQEEQNQS